MISIFGTKSSTRLSRFDQKVLAAAQRRADDMELRYPSRRVDAPTISLVSLARRWGIDDLNVAKRLADDRCQISPNAWVGCHNRYPVRGSGVYSLGMVTQYEKMLEDRHRMAMVRKDAESMVVKAPAKKKAPARKAAKR